MRYVEKTKRGVFGWIVKITFILFQFLMLMWFINYSSSVGEHFQNIDTKPAKQEQQSAPAWHMVFLVAYGSAEL